MMFSGTREEVLDAIAQIGGYICAYGGGDWASRRCDCKRHSTGQPIAGEANGCCELRDAHRALSQMTDAAWDALMSEPPSPRTNPGVVKLFIFDREENGFACLSSEGGDYSFQMSLSEWPWATPPMAEVGMMVSLGGNHLEIAHVFLDNDSTTQVHFNASQEIQNVGWFNALTKEGFELLPS